MTVPNETPSYHQSYNCSTPIVSSVHETSGSREEYGLLENSSNFDSFQNPSYIVLDNIAGSDLYLDVRHDETYPYKQYLNPESPARIPVPYNHCENEPRRHYHVVEDYSRSLIDLSYHNREVYSTYPDTIAVEQLNNQCLSPSSRYPRINFEQKEESRRPDNFSVIRRVSSSVNSVNATKSSACVESTINQSSPIVSEVKMKH